jgi:TfoX/Sxy family transcriptional regulator of competence genes
MQKRTWEKSSDNLITTFYEVMQFFPEAELRKMFGYPCAFFQGNMFVGLHEQRLVVRLDAKTRETALEQNQGTIFAPMNRVMKEYIALTPENINSSTRLKDFINQSLCYVRTLPPKKSG